MAIPDYQTLMLPVLRLAAQGETRVPDMAAQLEDEFSLTPGERDLILPSGRQRIFHNRIHWAKFYMSKAGLITSIRRGWFVATDAGRKLLVANPERIDVAQLMKIPSFAEFYDQSNSRDASAQEVSNPPPPPPVQVTPEEQIETAYLALRQH